MPLVENRLCASLHQGPGKEPWHRRDIEAGYARQESLSVLPRRLRLRESFKWPGIEEDFAHHDQSILDTDPFGRRSHSNGRPADEVIHQHRSLIRNELGAEIDAFHQGEKARGGFGIFVASMQRCGRALELDLGM